MIPDIQARSRTITHRTKGRRHGPITRLISPGDLGELVKPFVFLDLFEAESLQGQGFAPHPHSGIATVTLFLEGETTYADSTGKNGSLYPGSVEWMRAGKGVWHTGKPVPGKAMRGYQLWLSLPPGFELAEPESLYLEPSHFEAGTGVRVILGRYGAQISPIDVPASLTYLHVNLKPGQSWTYHPAADHDVAWLALNRGRLHIGDTVLEREIAVFSESADPIEMTAEGHVELIVASAAKHTYPLVTGYYSVHTSPSALIEGERRIAELESTAAVTALWA